MAITLEQAKALKPGDILFDKLKRKWKVNGKVKIWKRSPERVYVPLKHGLYSYGSLTEHNLAEVFIGTTGDKAP